MTSEQPASDSQEPSASNVRGTAQRPPLTDSPWFWGYIFTTAALIALALAAPKYYSRQTQQKRQFLARQEGGQTIKGADGKSIEPPNKDNLILRLGPLFMICSALLLVAWSRFWWTRFDKKVENKVADVDQRPAALPPQDSDPQS